MPRFAPPTEWKPTFTQGAPWARPLRRAAMRFCAHAAWPSVPDYDVALSGFDLRAASGLPLRFVPQPPASRRGRRKPASVDALYDGRIYTRGEVPTRARNWHDWLNVLVWASFPRAKAALNQRQYKAHRERLGDSFVALPGARTREQDALAMLDEGGLLLLTSASGEAEARAALAAGDVKALAGVAVPMVFGHALYEHLVVGDVSARGTGVVLVVGEVPVGEEAQRERADAALATVLGEAGSFVEVQSERGVVLGEVGW